MRRFLSKGAQLLIGIFLVEKRENLEQKNERNKRRVHIHQWLRLMLCGSVELFDRCHTPEVLPIIAYTVTLPPKGVLFPGVRYMKE